MAFDTLIVNGTVVDGTGASRCEADVGISDGRIEAVGALGHAEAERRIDATGHVVAPGFIDIHSHSDVTLLEDPGGESKAYQGVTTEVTGNCSYTPFPAGKGGPQALQENIGRALIGNVKWEWNTLDEWAEAMESNGVSINVAPQLGQAALQISSGAIEDRPATPDEMREMQRLAAEAMEMGAFSLSTGLTVAPSGYATTDDIVELCASVRHYDGAFYATHARGGNGLHMTAIEEAIEIGQRADIPVQFSHMAITDRRAYGDGPKMVDLLVKAREGGLDITYDVYPYTAAGAGYNQLVPLWAQEGTIADFMARLRDPATRTRIRDEVRAGLGGLTPQWETWYVAFIQSEENRHYVGKNVSEIAEERGRRAVGGRPATTGRGERLGANARPQPRGERCALLLGPRPRDDWLRREGGVAERALRQRAAASARFYGTYPRILGRYVREEPAVLTLENAIYKMTGFPVQRLGMKDRGLVKEGLTADLVVFDPGRSSTTPHGRTRTSTPTGYLMF